jgi:hypothetical protein
MLTTHSWSLSNHFRNIVYITNSWERSDEDIIVTKVGGEKKQNAVHHDCRTCQVSPLRYVCLRHAQQILKYALSNGPHDWNNRTLEQLEEDTDWISTVCK